MGGGASVPQDLTADKVASHLTSFGEMYEPYAKKLLENDVNGVFLDDCAEEDLHTLFEEVGVQSMMHKKKLSAEFKSFKESRGSSVVAAPAAADVKQAPPMPKTQAPQLPALSGGKRYRGFLSHFKHECGTEARLVHNEMSEILPGEDIFLDSGKDEPTIILSFLINTCYYS